MAHRREDDGPDTDQCLLLAIKLSPFFWSSYSGASKLSVRNRICTAITGGLEAILLLPIFRYGYGYGYGYPYYGCIGLIRCACINRHRRILDRLGYPVWKE
ncbi:hypothetical protein PRIPAC_96829 [Pristionchus pacificus]|uniref:Uncharacterized protein n=1 Tax=Pristionchus pacificus TaxID=54126 RepID=A0A8R1UMD3_PRIPA|nr:hypothetical protein PRIPAC_96829 [Pristionchus pacificus]|eukprot:PDM60223.1 hypothetical protein PRIPAC_54048 [Pristionchus pacificus]